MRSRARDSATDEQQARARGVLDECAAARHRTTLNFQLSTISYRAETWRLARLLNSFLPMDDKLPQDFRERAFRFTLKLFDYCAELGRIPGPTRCVGDQLFDAGNSIGANLAESKGSYSRKELAAALILGANGLAVPPDVAVRRLRLATVRDALVAGQDLALVVDPRRSPG